jgi:hypothetical protein
MTMAMMEEKFNALNQTVEVMIYRLTRIVAALYEKNKNKE